MSNWKIIKHSELPKLKNPILIEGLPGIGNVGKIAIDFLIEELKAKKIYDFFSYAMPNSVFVNEQNLVDLPAISLHHRKIGNQDILIVGGDVQPITEQASYEFSDMLIDLVKSMECNEIITLAGIGLPQPPVKPKVYCTGNSPGLIKKYTKGTGVDNKLYGIVGPIMGVSGLLLGLSKRKQVNAVSLLAETYGHPMYLGVKGARELVIVFNKVLKLKIDFKDLNKEISEIDGLMKKTRGITELKQMKKVPGAFKEVSYIG